MSSIGDDAFEQCTSLVSIVVPAACTSIGSSAFRECSALQRVELPAAIRKLGGNAFAKCVSLRELYCAAPLPPSIAHSTFKGTTLAALRIVVPKGAKVNYTNDKQWSKLPYIVEQQQ